MSYYTSAHFYRPGPPPTVTTGGLVGFLRKLNQCKLIEGTRLVGCEINFAKAISEKVPDFWKRVTSKPRHHRVWWKRLLSTKPEVTTTISKMHHIPADFEHKGGSLEGAIDALCASNQTIGRLHVGGMLPERMWGLFDTEHPSGEPLNFRPDGWSLTFGPTNMSMLQWDEIDGIQTGWASFAIHGPGYFFPWTFPEWVERFTQDSRLQEVCRLCRETWPVVSTPPGKKLVAARRNQEDWWPYDDPHAPLDWAWGPEEG